MRARALAENEFSVSLFGRVFPFCKQTARQRLAIERRAAGLLPALMGYGLSGEEARALAYNCVLLWQTLRGEAAPESPEAVLDTFTLGQIARLCEGYWRQGDLPFGDWDEGGQVPEEGEA